MRTSRRSRVGETRTRKILAVRSWIDLDVQERALLRTLVCDTTDELKSAAISPERSVLRIRDIAREAGFHPGEVFREEDIAADVAKEHLLTDLTRWRLECYFAAASD